MPTPQGPYRLAVRAGDTLYVSGQLGRRDGALVEGVQAQVRQALENLESILRDHGTDRSAVVKVTVYLDDMEDWPAMNEPYGEFFGDQPPARTAVAVEALPGGALVELDAVAWLG